MADADKQTGNSGHGSTQDEEMGDVQPILPSAIQQGYTNGGTATLQNATPRADDVEDDIYVDDDGSDQANEAE